MKKILLFIIVVLFIGCGQAPVKNNIEQISYSDMVKHQEKTISFANSDEIKYLPYKPNILGKGLLYQPLNQAFNQLQKQYPDLFNKEIKIATAFIKDYPDKYKFINEVRIFAKAHNYKFIEPKNIISKLSSKIFKRGRIRHFNKNRTIFHIYFEPLKKNNMMIYITDESRMPIIPPISVNLKKLENAKFSIVQVPYGNTQPEQYVDKYAVLKNVIYKNGRVLNNLNFTQADFYCRKHFPNSSIVALYPFEYALRQGAIKPPQGAFREFVAPYDPDLGDNKYKNYGDKVNIEDKDETSQSQILVYNWNKREYEKVLRNDNKNIAFRCMIYKGQE